MSSSLPSGVQHVSEPTSVGGLPSWPWTLDERMPGWDLVGRCECPLTAKSPWLSPPEKCRWAPHLRGFPKGDAVLWCSQQVAPMTSIPLLGDGSVFNFRDLTLLEEMNVGSRFALVTELVRYLEMRGLFIL